MATSLASIKAGATQVECTLNGIGERAGNAALEEIVMALKTRRDFFDCYHPHRYNARSTVPAPGWLGSSGRISPTTRPSSERTPSCTKPAFTSMACWPNGQTYEIMTPESIGIVKNNIVLGKHSGRHAFEDRLVSLGYQLPEEAIAKLFEKFKVLCDRKKDVYGLRPGGVGGEHLPYSRAL